MMTLLRVIMLYYDGNFVLFSPIWLDAGAASMCLKNYTLNMHLVKPGKHN